MKVSKGFEDLPKRKRRRAVTIGNFDGVHRGHKAVISKLLSRAAEISGEATAVTFDPHPQQVLRGEGPSNLTTLDRRIELLAEAGIEHLVVVRFNRRLSKVEPEDFISNHLVEVLGAEALVVGRDFTFGRFARGDVTMLRSFGRRLGFRFDSVTLKELRGRRLSSTEIRYALAQSDLGWANLALGRDYELSGKVVRGAGRGKALGFPTANFRVPNGVCMPGNGIYGGYLKVGGKINRAAVSIGTNPTFGTNPTTVEAYVLDFSRNIYGLDVNIVFKEFLRPERRFGTPGALARAIAEDVERVRRYPPAPANR